CDLMREMLDATKHKQAMDKQRVKALHDEIDGILKSSGPALVAAPPPPPPAPIHIPNAEPERSGWRIHFVPGAKLLRNGNDPLRILRELCTLGPCTIRVDAKFVPPLADLDPEECRLGWHVELNGPVPEAQVRAVFEWVDTECELHLEAFGPMGAV